jgi:hypothetical protein
MGHGALGMGTSVAERLVIEHGHIGQEICITYYPCPMPHAPCPIPSSFFLLPSSFFLLPSTVKNSQTIKYTQKAPKNMQALIF